MPKDPGTIWKQRELNLTISGDRIAFGAPRSFNFSIEFPGVRGSLPEGWVSLLSCNKTKLKFSGGKSRPAIIWGRFTVTGVRFLIRWRDLSPPVCGGVNPSSSSRRRQTSILWRVDCVSKGSNCLPRSLRTGIFPSMRPMHYRSSWSKAGLLRSFSGSSLLI